MAERYRFKTGPLPEEIKEAKGKKYSPRAGEGVYKPEWCEMAYVACSSMGATDKKLMKLFGISSTRFYELQHAYPEFRAAIIKGKDEYNTQVAEKSLQKKVEGYLSTEVTREINEAGDLVVTKKVKKHVAPSDTAIMYFLNNRNPERWQSRNAVDLNGKLDTMTDEQLDKRIAQLLGAVGAAPIVGGAGTPCETLED